LLKAVFHINEQEKWLVLLSNIRNLLKETSDVEIKVIANGSGVKGYIDVQLIEQIIELKGNRIHFEACQNALNAHQIGNDQLAKWISVIPAGIVRLIELQPEFAYIKP